MSNYIKGNDYELFVETVYQALLAAEKESGQIGGVNIERKKIITSKSGTPAEIDLYWEYEIAGIKNSVAIECKNYNKNVGLPQIRDFARKISDISGLKGLVVTKKGFSKNAIKEAKADSIDLLIIREQQDVDWEDRISRICLRLHVLTASRAIDLQPRYNNKWMLANGYKKGDQISFQFVNNKLFFEDKEDGFRHSLLDLENKHFFEGKDPGEHIWERSFKDGWMTHEEDIFKIDAIKIKYINDPITQTEMNIDLTSYILAIMEYISGQGGKYVVLRNGEKREYD